MARGWDAKMGSYSYAAPKGSRRNNFTVGEANCVIMGVAFRAQIWVRLGRDD